MRTLPILSLLSPILLAATAALALTACGHGPNKGVITSPRNEAPCQVPPERGGCETDARTRPTGPELKRDGYRRADLADELRAATDDIVAKMACDATWAMDGDAWQECVCTLETWRCTAQGWCGEPGEARVLPEPSAAMYWKSSDAEGCQ